MQRNTFSHKNRKLCAVRDNEKSPRERDGRHEPPARSKRESNDQRTRSAERHRANHEALATNAISDKSAPHTTNTTNGDDAERKKLDELIRGSCGYVRCGRRREKRRNPRPVRVELGHVA